jgi:hypothetical protein
MKQPVSLLPEDFVVAARERRIGLLAAALFPVMLAAVFGAFLVTNRQWGEVRAAQSAIDRETERAAHEIAEMKSLERIRTRMDEKAELARGLLEPVPRSVLLAILVNTMPQQVAMHSLELRAEEIKPTKPDARADAKAVAKPDLRKPDPKAKPAVAEAQPPARRRTTLVMIGYAPSLLEVGRWMSALERVPVFSSIRLELMEEKVIDGRGISEFRIALRIDPDADLRAWKDLGSLRAGRLPDEVATALAEPGARDAEVRP